MGKKVMCNILINFKRFLLISSLILVTISWAQAREAVKFSTGDFITMYPGVPLEKEKALVQKYITDNKAIEDRDGIDVKALINGTLPEDTPGISTTIVATEALIRYENQKYDPENPVLNDAEYAKKMGYENIFALPPFAAHDDSFLVPYPIEARDTFLAADLNHNITYYKPIYPGDTLYLVVNSRHFLDITPQEGFIYRSVAIQTEGSIYNQKGEKVNDVIYRVIENLMNYKEDKRPENPQRVVPDWLSRPAHYYTDEDWDLIKDIWSKEKRQGATPLYWEEVKIGDEPAWTLDGPIDTSRVGGGGGGGRRVIRTGMSTGGARTLKKEIMDPEIFKTMIRGEKDGIYRLPNREDYFPVVPVSDITPMGGESGGAPGAQGGPPGTQGGPPDGQNRSTFMNTQGRELALRHISNWMGEHGWFYNIRWSMMSPDNLADFGYIVPESPLAERFLEMVPKMKGKHVNAHGITGDVGIVKSYVYDKYVRDNEFFVELAWWVESIDGYIWMEGGATVKLPSKNVK
ncbi:MaoC family dehydratase N-terminal domain-containing protein [Deltaproteobacteria bacterium]|nr:MaoC family dehydratase N-terminal domain-containing protein [Deltaproteobacteria bacterium]